MKVLSFSQQGSRNYHQDNLYISEEKQIFAVCDGVGGSADGFLASNMVVNSLQSQYPGHATLHDKDSIGDYLFDVLSAFRHDQIEEIATTMTFLTIVGPTAFLYHIGDSRIFYISPSRSKWYVTKDHSYVQELFEAGILTSENEMRTHPMRNRITKVISNTNPLTQQDIEIETIHDVLPGDMFLLCSDGALESFSNEDLVYHFSDNHIPLDLQWNSFQEICAQNSKDNNTAILVSI